MSSYVTLRQIRIDPDIRRLDLEALDLEVRVHAKFKLKSLVPGVKGSVYELRRDAKHFEYNTELLSFKTDV